MDQSTCATPSSTTTPLPTRPKRRLTADLTDTVRDAWGHIPTAAHAPASMTRQQVTQALGSAA